MNLIIGNGNLGVDLKKELLAAGKEAVLLSTGDGFKWPDDLKKIREMNPKVIWITAGAGSVDQCATMVGFESALSTHVYLPVSMALAFPEAKIVAFSSDYAADESDMHATGRSNPRPKSLYAASKVWMEQGFTFLSRPNTCVVRVCNLYGDTFPERCLPAKLKKRYPTPQEVPLPQNLICPTPTWWVAKMLIKNANKLFSEQGFLIHHLAPIGNCTVIQWARKILGAGYTFVPTGFDKQRPSFSHLGCSLAMPESTWEMLWEQHLRRAQSGPSRKSSGQPGRDHHPSRHPSEV